MKCNKFCGVLLLASLLTFGLVSAWGWPPSLPPDTGFVDCGHPDYFDNQLCTDEDLEDEFGIINDAISDLEDGLKKNKKVNKKQSKAISSLEVGLNASNSYLASREADYLQDKGIGMSKVKAYLEEVFLEKLYSLFVTKDDLALSEARIVFNTFEENDDVCTYARALRVHQTGNEDYRLKCGGWIYQN